MAIEIVDIPSYEMAIFHSYVGLPEGKHYSEPSIANHSSWTSEKNNNSAVSGAWGPHLLYIRVNRGWKTSLSLPHHDHHWKTS